MLRPRKITFYKMMLAGYLSAEAYRALKPKMQIGELSFSDCFGFEPQICNELKRLFEEDTMDHLYLLEKIEESIKLEWDNIHNLLLKSIKDIAEDLLSVINAIGEKTFAMNYVFCTDACFKELNHVTDNNFEALNKVRKQFAIFYIGYLETGSLPEIPETHHTPARAYTNIVSDDTFMVSEPFGEYSVASGRGFSYRNNFVIDDDALGINNSDCKKYVLYLYSLDSERFEKFQDYLFITTSNCSVRLCNAIKSIGYRNFLVNYLFADDTKFFQIKNFGRKSLFEFNSIKSQIINFIISEYNGANTEAVEKEIQKEEEITNYESLTLKEKVGEVQYALLTNLLKTLMSKVSVRSQNGINNYKGDFIEDFVHKSNDVKSIKQIGRKSEIEINLIISHLREAIENLEQRELTKEEVFWIEKSSVYSNLIDDFCHNYYRSNGHLPMFHILANCLYSLQKDNRYVKVFDAVVSLFSDEGGNELENVANEHNLTRERIRQIYVSTINNLSEMRNQDDSNIPLYHKLIAQKEDWAYVLQVLSEKKLWKIDELTDILQQEECSLNKELVIVVLSAIFSDSFVVVGKDPLSISSRSDRWAKAYLIAKKLFDCFDFDMMIQIVKDYENTNTESLTSTAEELLINTFSRAWKKFDPLITEELEPVISRILIDELGLIPDLNFKFTLIGKKEKNPADILYALLKRVGDPLTIECLYSEIQSVFPNRYRSADSLKAIIRRDSRLCQLGTDNMVVLSEWDHVQLGNIRELIVAYLAQFEEPKHIDDIVDYMLTLRSNITKKNISANMDDGSQFVKFPVGFYGLADRKYPKLPKQDYIWLGNCMRYEKFCKLNGKRPSQPPLKNWFSKAMTDFENRKLSPIREKAFVKLCKSL